LDSVDINIYDAKYENGSGSKANRLRAFWTIEPNHVVYKLLADLLQFVREHGVAPGDEERFNACLRAVERLKQSAPVADLGAISPISDEKEFAVLARSVRQATSATSQPKVLIACTLFPSATSGLFVRGGASLRRRRSLSTASSASTSSN
jgi:hypothetical protein